MSGVSRLFTFVGALLAFLWLFLLVLGGLSDLVTAMAGETPVSLFDYPVPWFRWLTYATLFCVIGACCQVVETAHKKETDK